MDSKTLGIVSYLTLIGWIIALVMNTSKDEYVRFHLRQALLLHLAGLIWMIPIIGWLLGVATLVFWIMGLVSAINGKQEPLPAVGPLAQQWFAGL